MRYYLAVFMALATTPFSYAEIVTRKIEYKQASTAFESVLIYDGASQVKRPGLLLIHEQGPASANAKAKGEALARLGYVVLSVDLYGKGVPPRNADEAISKLGLSGTDRKLVRDRTAAARAELDKVSQVDPKRIGGVGFGVGGTAILELARAKADLKGAVCVHGDLTPTGLEGKNVGAVLLVIVGADDPKIPLSQVAAFEEEMRQGEVDWQLIRFGGVGGDFTNPQAGRNLKTGRAYDPDADQRTNDAIKMFLAETFPPSARPGAVPVKPTSSNKPSTGVSNSNNGGNTAPKGVPEKALRVLEFVDKNGDAMQGYEGGRTFGNFERRLPQTDSSGRRIRYREWDVNPLRPGVNRGAERLVTGSDGSAHYTDDHYSTFKKIR